MEIRQNLLSASFLQGVTSSALKRGFVGINRRSRHHKISTRFGTDPDLEHTAKERAAQPGLRVPEARPAEQKRDKDVLGSVFGVGRRRAGSDGETDQPVDLQPKECCRYTLGGPVNRSISPSVRRAGCRCPRSQVREVALQTPPPGQPRTAAAPSPPSGASAPPWRRRERSPGGSVGSEGSELPPAIGQCGPRPARPAPPRADRRHRPPAAQMRRKTNQANTLTGPWRGRYNARVPTHRWNAQRESGSTLKRPRPLDDPPPNAPDPQDARPDPPR